MSKFALSVIFFFSTENFDKHSNHRILGKYFGEQQSAFVREKFSSCWLDADPHINWRGADGFGALICGKSRGKWKFCAASGIARDKFTFSFRKFITRTAIYETQLCSYKHKVVFKNHMVLINANILLNCDGVRRDRNTSFVFVFNENKLVYTFL